MSRVQLTEGSLSLVILASFMGKELVYDPNIRFVYEVSLSLNEGPPE